MAVSNKLVQKDRTGEPKTFSKYLSQEKVQQSLLSTLGNQKSMEKFTSSVLSAVSINHDLQQCDFGSVVSAGLLANALELSLSPSLGFAYLVPFKDNKNNRTTATFILGYRGYIQLAIRSGYYKKLIVADIKDGELVKADSINEEYVFSPIEDFNERENAKTIGYYAMFEHVNGFVKKMYWSKEKMLSHADRYSKAFSLNGDKYHKPYKDYVECKIPSTELWKYSSHWYVDFDEMSKKTMIRQLLSKWGVMSIDMQKAYDDDTESMMKTEETENLEDEDAFDTFFDNEEKTESEKEVVQS